MAAPLFILGPTGCGKSAVAVELACRLGCAEIISADAYQAYRRMPVLTAAPSPEERDRVPHHLVGFLDVSENNDAATHARRAEKCLQDLAVRGASAVITGGSGLYVRFLSHGISPAPPSDPLLREELNALPLEEAVRRFREADPEGAAMTDLCNPRYVVRNLEIVLLGGKPLSYWKGNWQKEPLGPGFQLVRETADLDARIARRSRAMLEQGVIDEVEALPPVLSPTAAKTLGLQQVRDYLAGRLSREELEASLALATRQYAKRQRTWLRRENWAVPVPVRPGDTPSSVCGRILRLIHGTKEPGQTT